jgi:transposase
MRHIREVLRLHHSVGMSQSAVARSLDSAQGTVSKYVTAQIFVAVLGTSNYTYAEATLTQSLPDWIASHVRAFSYFGGAARQTISDNLKAGVTRACFHEPMVNRTYADPARHYGTAISPARLPIRHRHSRSRQALRARSSRCRLCTGTAPQRAFLQVRRFDPSQRQPLRPRTRGGRRPHPLICTHPDYRPQGAIAAILLAVSRHRPSSQLRSNSLWMGKLRLKMKLRQYSIWLMA